MYCLFLNVHYFGNNILFSMNAHHIPQAKAIRCVNQQNITNNSRYVGMWFICSLSPFHSIFWDHCPCIYTVIILIFFINSCCFRRQLDSWQNIYIFVCHMYIMYVPNMYHVSFLYFWIQLCSCTFLWVSEISIWR